jgi:tRNA 2-thiouridine synthesizing protein A
VSEEGGLVVDARGSRCPVPVLRLATAVRGLPAGTEATVLATDPAVEHDVPAWARMRGHTVLELSELDGTWTVRVRTTG